MIEILIFGLVLLAVICLWLLIEGRKNPKFLVWFIPVVLVLVSSTYVTYTSILGYPRYDTPKEGLYLKHYVDEPNWIYLWVVYKNKVESSKIPPEWHLWIHFLVKNAPSSKAINKFSWQKKHEENLTGTLKAYKPDGSLGLNSKKNMKKYETWKS